MRHEDYYLNMLEFDTPTVLNDIDCEPASESFVEDMFASDDFNKDVSPDETSCMDKDDAMQFAHACESLFIEPFENNVYGALECLVNDMACIM